MKGLTIVVSVVMACACTRSDKARPTPVPAEASAPWTRAQWLAQAEELVAQTRSLDQLRTGAGRQRFDALIGTNPWVGLDFGRDSEDMLRYFPLAKKLQLTLTRLAAADELAALGLYNLDVYDAFMDAGRRFVAALPGDDPTRAARISGVSRMLLGYALSICELLYYAVDASDPLREAALRRLADPVTYTHHSTITLQLILATLDEYLLADDNRRDRAQLQAIRDRVSAVRAELPELAPGVRITYEGMPPPRPLLAGQARISRTGGFAVDLPSAALVKQVEMVKEDGSLYVQHAIEARSDNLVLEAHCFDGATEEQLVAGIAAVAGATAITRSQPGHWFDVQTPTRVGRIRITTLHGRACAASIEGPAAEVPAALLESFPASLRLAPAGRE